MRAIDGGEYSNPVRESRAQRATAPPDAPSRRVKVTSWLTDPAGGWDTRLWCSWALYTALAYTIILGVIWLLGGLGLDQTRVALDHRALAALLIATFGAALYGGVLGVLQWRVLRQRIPIARREWVKAAVVPALCAWLLVVLPAGAWADSSGKDLRVAYFLAVSQALALGPLIGLGQAKALRPYTDRWRWWIAASIVSYLIVAAIAYVLSLVIGPFDFTHGKGTPIEAYIILIATTPLSGRWLLWVTAPAATHQ